MEITAGFVKHSLPARDAWGHKGTFGKIYCLCGSVGFTGAPVFASRAATVCGSGLVYLGVPQSIWQVVAIKSDEAMPFPLADLNGKLALSAEETIRRQVSSCDAVLIGCGLGRSIQSDKLVRRLLDIPKPLVLDADGINALSGHMDRLQCRHGHITVLTPHDGEFSRVGELTEDRVESAKKFAQEHDAYLILKGHRTIVAAPDGRIGINTTGNSGMAKGGSGDVLSGIIVSLLGQGMDAFEACCCGVWIHGRAGDLAAQEKGERGMTPSDLLLNLPYAIKRL